MSQTIVLPALMDLPGLDQTDEPRPATTAIHLEIKKSSSDAEDNFNACKPKTKTQTEPLPYQKYILQNIQKSVEDEEFYGIRALFAMQSPVFNSMLYGRMMESNPSNQVVLHDVTTDALKYLRATFYNLFDKEAKHSILTADIVVDVLFAAQKYIITPLVAKCMSFIANIRNVDDWYSVLGKLETSAFQMQ